MKINTEELLKNINKVKAGDRVFLSGTLYTARDAAHKRIVENKKSPINLKNASIYYCGPAPKKPGQIIGACGPTTSSRMDEFTPKMLGLGVKFLIGKGKRSKEVVEAIKKNKAVYFIATGGVAALLSKMVVKAEVVAFKEFGPEAIYKLEVKDMPLIVAVDSRGNDVFSN